MNIALLTYPLLLLVLAANVSGLTSCNFRCNVWPTLMDHFYPTGCYCHSACGGKFPCCFDQYKCDGDHACQTPSKVYHATHTGGRRLFYAKKETITYTCDFRYEMTGISTRTCLGNNIWSRPPSCRYLSRVCSPPRVKNGNYVVEKRQYKPGEQILITCDAGYVIQGPPLSRCSGYSWDPYPSECREDRCVTHRKYCDKNHGECINYRYYAKCRCKEGYTGDGWRCTRIPCYMHTCKTNEKCVDSGDESGRYICECTEGYVKDGATCRKDLCFGNNCHENAICTESGLDFACLCNVGFTGNGIYCIPVIMEVPEGDENYESSGEEPSNTR